MRLSSEGNGFNVSLKITKSNGEPIRLVPEGTPGATVVAVKRVDELGFYSLSLTDIKDKVGLTMPKTHAIVKHLKLRDNPDYFKKFTIGKSDFNRYSPKALEKIVKELPSLDIEEIWEKNKPKGRKKEDGK